MTRNGVALVTFGALSLLLITGADLGAQRIPPRLAGEAQPPKEIQEFEALERRVAADPVRQVTREDVLKALEEQNPGATRAENLRSGKPLPASAEAAREIRELEAQERAVRAARQPGLPNREQLLEALRQAPEGRAMLEEAQRRGAPISSAGRGTWWDRFVVLNPFRVRKAWAQSKFSVALTPSTPKSSSPYAAFGFFGGGGPSAYFALFPQSGAAAGINYALQSPHASLTVQVPATGFYVVNFRAMQLAGGSRGPLQIRMVHGNKTVVGSWEGNSIEWRNYPVVLELSQGYHWFRLFTLGSGSQTLGSPAGIQVSSTSVFAL